MKVNKEEILQLIYSCIDDVNLMLAEDASLNKNLDAIIVGEGGVLDSLSLINLLVAIEEELNLLLKVQFFLLDEELLGDSEGPYQTVGHLYHWILNQID